MRMDIGLSEVSMQNVQLSVQYFFFHLKLLTSAILFKISWWEDALDNIYLTYSPCFCFLSLKLLYAF